jgi:hypothetical protein
MALQSKKKLYNEEINLAYFLNNLLSKKIYIILSSLSFSFLFFIYNINLNNNLNFLKSEITLKRPSSEIFNIYGNLLYSENADNLSPAENFFIDFVIRLKSKDNLENYLKNNFEKADIENLGSKFFKTSLNSQIKFGEKKNQYTSKDSPSFYFIYPKGVQGHLLLNDYILQTGDILQMELKENLIKNLKFNMSIDYSEKNITELGKKKINNLNFVIDHIEKNDFKYNPISGSASEGKPIENIGKFVLFGLLFGFFMSLLYFFLKVVSFT